jgi:hypothetical protein
MLLLLALLQQNPTEPRLPELEHPGAEAPLRQVVDRICGDPGTLDRSGLLKREDDVSYDAHSSKASAATWIKLACVRGALEGDGAFARSGLEMVAGDSWNLGGEHAALEALRIEPTNPVAAELLAVLVLDDLWPDPEAVAGMFKAHAAGSVAPGVLRACAEFSLRANDVKTAQACAMQGLARGVDSTWHLLRLARIAFREADTVSGTKRFVAAISAAHDTAARAETEWHLQWFLAPEELPLPARLSDSARGAWIRDLLVRRDVRDGQPVGARLAEHFSRLEYALAHFRLHVPVTIRKHGGLVAAQGENQLSPDSIRSFCEPGLLPAVPFRYYRQWQREIDDRGVVWLRFGAPAKTVKSHPVCADTIISDRDGPAANTREAWLYEIDGESMVLQFEVERFSGSIEATRLVTGVLGSYLCAGIDTKRCALTSLSIANSYANRQGGTPPATPFVSVEDIAHIREQDQQWINVATTKDDNSPRGDRNIAMHSELHRLWDPLTQAPIALVTYALPVKELSVQSRGPQRTTVVDLELRQWDGAVEKWRDTSFSRHFELPDTNVKRPNLVGFVAVGSTPGVSAWSLVATQPDQRRGRAFDLSTPGLGTGPVALSDLVLGAETEGIRWSLHNVDIPLAPTGSLDRKAVISLYYQIRSESARSDLRTTVALYKLDDGAVRDSAALQVSFEQVVRRGVNEVAPTLDVSRLDTGRYQLMVVIADPAGSALSRRHVILDLE